MESFSRQRPTRSAITHLGRQRERADDDKNDRQTGEIAADVGKTCALQRDLAHDA